MLSPTEEELQPITAAEDKTDPLSHPLEVVVTAVELGSEGPGKRQLRVLDAETLYDETQHEPTLEAIAYSCGSRSGLL